MRRSNWLSAILAAAGAAHAQDAYRNEHVPPDPPQTRVHDMPYRDMAQMMGMDDRRRFSQVMLDRLEWQGGDESAFAWNAAAWYGGDIDKLRLEAEGERTADRTEESRTELAWDRIVTPWWSTRLGLRHDAGIGPSRDWAAFGLAGRAPGLVDIEAGLYLGEGGRSALRLTTERDFLLTQRLVLQPELELEAYGEPDPDKLLGSGLSNLKLGLRIRYEIRREFAPFVGIRWVGRFGGTEQLRRNAGLSGDEFLALAGIRAWF
jgi:copper resistance protein B